MTQWKKKRQTMRHYDYSAPVYDTQYHQEQEAKIKAALPRLALKKENIILDAGCGTGLLVPYVAEKVKMVLGVDVSKIILLEAKKKVERQQNVALVRADADYTPFKNQFFDAAFAITLLQNMPNPHQTLTEIKRMTKRNAIIVVTGLKKAFSQKRFKKLLAEAELEINVLTLDEHSREYVAKCVKP